MATPIGNLEDISARAARILGEVDLILAEDTRHSRKLLAHLGIRTPVHSCHEFNEQRVAARLEHELHSGTVALISDAGTPLISDPGFRVVAQALALNAQVIPIPGPCALISALSVAGLPTHRFLFAGFAPEKSAARCRFLEALAHETATLAFYEAPHRITGFLADAVAVFGGRRRAVLARELTKLHESVCRDTLSGLAASLQEQTGRPLGEFVVLIEGAPEQAAGLDLAPERVLQVLLGHAVPLSSAAAIAADLCGGRRNEMYRLALDLQQRARPDGGSRKA